VLSVGGHSLGSNVASVFDLVDVIKDNPGRALDFEVRRQELPDLLHVNIGPDVAYDGAGKIGVQLSTNARLHRVKANNLREAVLLMRFWLWWQTVKSLLKTLSDQRCSSLLFS